MNPIKISHEAGRILDQLPESLTAIEKIAILRTAAHAVENSLSAEVYLHTIKSIMDPDK